MFANLEIALSAARLHLHFTKANLAISSLVAKGHVVRTTQRLLS